MSDNRPDTVVREEQVREAKDRLATGLAADARASGRVPDARAIENFANAAVQEQVARHEDVFADGPPEKPPPAPAPAEVRPPEGAEAIARPLGAFDWDTAPGGSMRPVGPVSPRLARRAAKQKNVDPLLKERLDFLLGMPDWNVKIIAAWEAGLIASRGDLTVATAHAMKVVETSIRLFGDWRTPRRPSRKIIVG